MESSKSLSSLARTKFSAQREDVDLKLINGSLAWMELRTTLALVIWTFDLELDSACENLDWHKDLEMHSLWKKPQLLVRAKLAKHDVEN